MKYFKNTELAKLYHVSEKSVRNWIAAAQESKLDIKLYNHNGKAYIADTAKNNSAIEALVTKGKKYKNSRGLKVVTPKPNFYDTYDTEQILHILSSLTVHHEIPTQYTYSDGGAKFWDAYATRLNEDTNPNILNQTTQLLDKTADSLSSFTEGYGKVNVVDLGPGNGLPIRSTLGRLLDQGVLNRYVAIDASKEMLTILERNIKKWFGGKVRFEGVVRDFSREQFDDLFVDDYARNEKDVPLNLVFLLGNTLNNFNYPEQVLYNINSSLGVNDLLIYSGYLDTPKTRRYFDFVPGNNNTQSNQKIRSELILELLGIDDSLYSLDTKYDEIHRARSICMVPEVDICIDFTFTQGTRRVELRKGEPILLWRGKHQNTIETISQFYDNGFDLAQVATTRDQHYLLLTSRIRIYWPSR